MRGPKLKHAQHNNLASAVLLRQPPSPEKALSHFRKAVELSPMDGQIRFNLAAVLEVLKDLEGALASNSLTST